LSGVAWFLACLLTYPWFNCIHLFLPGAAYNLPALQKAGITHILSLTPAAPCKWPALFQCLNITTLHDDDLPENRISQYFNLTLPFIDGALKGSGRVLVHCWKGKSRSVSTIIAYLIDEYGWTPDYALEDIKHTRSIATPNHEYWQELQDYYHLMVGADLDSEHDGSDYDDDHSDYDDDDDAVERKRSLTV
jgi:protein-tyrosine phosphatase